MRYRREPAERPSRCELRWDRRAAALGFAALALGGCSAQDETQAAQSAHYAEDPPPSDAECDSIISPDDTAADQREVRAICAKMQDPVVWRSGHAPVPFPPPPESSRNFFRSRD
jgi:hypothetical protein